MARSGTYWVALVTLCGLIRAEPAPRGAAGEGSNLLFDNVHSAMHSIGAGADAFRVSNGTWLWDTTLDVGNPGG